MSLKSPESKDSMFFENKIAPEWLCTKEAAAILGITANALRIRKCRGEIECRYFGKLLRFNRDYLLTLFREQRNKQKD